MTDELHSGLGSLRTDDSVENTCRLPSEDLMFQVSLLSFTLSRPFFLSLSLSLSRTLSLAKQLSLSWFSSEPCLHGERHAIRDRGTQT